MTTITGHLLTVNTIPLGSPLDGAHPSGATTLLVVDPLDFSEGGGWLNIGSEVLSYDSVDLTTRLVTLTTPLLNGYAGDTRVNLYDPDAANGTGAPATELEAQVAPEGDPGGDPVFAEVAHALKSFFVGGIGVATPVVTLERLGDAWIITNVLGQSPALDGAVVWNPHSYRTKNPATFPAGAWTAATSWADVETDGVTYSAGSWTIQIPAWYSVTAWLTWALNATNRRRIRILVNGIVQRTSVVPADPDIETYSQIDIEARLAEGDVVTIEVFQGTGAGLQITDGAFSIHRLSV